MSETIGAAAPLHHLMGEENRGKEWPEAGPNSLFTQPKAEEFDRYLQAVANISATVRVWPHQTLEDYERFFAAKRQHEAQFQRSFAKTPQKPRPIADVAADAFSDPSVLIEIIGEPDRGTRVVVEFTQEYHRLRMAAAQQLTPE